MSKSVHLNIRGNINIVPHYIASERLCVSKIKNLLTLFYVMNCYEGIINIELLCVFQSEEMINIVLHIQELWSPKNENVHVLKLLKAEGLPTLFYMSKNCCEMVSKQIRGIANIVLHLEEPL